ncbi:MAG: MFS transporter [Sporichthyaceae bacterium]|nr:MFS transporter [Sporichthyaceae bacterium]
MLAQLIPSPGPARTLGLARLLMSTGEGAFVTCSALYFTRIVGLTATQLGIGLAIAGCARMLAGVPFGHLADQHGPREVAILLGTLTGLASAGYLLTSGFVGYVVVACSFAILMSGYQAASQAVLAGVIEGEALVRTRAQLRAIVNVGFSVGAGVGALALVADTKPAYLGVLGLNAIALLGCAAVQTRLPHVPRSPAREAGEPRLAVLRDPGFVWVTVINSLMVIHFSILEIGIPLWIVTHTEAPRPLIAGLLVVNTVSVVLLQIRVTSRIGTLDTAVRAFRFSGLLLAGACLAFAASAGQPAVVASVLLVIAALVQVTGEMTQSAGSWVISYDLAPAGKQGQYQGFFMSGTFAMAMFGPPLLTLLVVEWGAPGWFVLAGLFLAAGSAMGPAVRWATRDRPGSDDHQVASAEDPVTRPEDPVTLAVTS